MIGNIFPNMELIWRKNDGKKRNDTNACNTYTPPRGCAPTREGAASTTAPNECEQTEATVFLEWKMKGTW